MPAAATETWKWHHVGPHGFYDLVRLARSGRTAVVRVLYILALAAAPAVVHYNATSRDHTPLQGAPLVERINHNANIARNFSITILLAQNLAVLILMPIYCAASIQEERDKRTFPLLFTTQLTSREIVQGKLLSRMGHVGSVILAGLPVLSVVQLWGGIDMPMIAANFWNAGLLLFSVGAFSLSVAIQSRNSTRAIIVSFVFLAGLVGVCCVPVQSMAGGSLFLLAPDRGDGSYAGMWTEAAVAAFFHVFVALWFIHRAARILEARRGDDSVGPDALDWIGIQESARGDAEPHAPLWARPPVAEPALAWNERYMNRSSLFALPWIVMVFLTAGGIPLLMMTVIAWENDDAAGLGAHLAIFRAGMLITCGAYILAVTVRMTGCIVRERQQQTLDALLTLPMGREEILWGKLRGNLLRFWTWLLPAGVCWMAVSLHSSEAAGRGVLLLIALAAHLAFFANLGLMFSVVCRTAVAAYVALALAVMLIFLGTPLAPVMLGLDKSGSELFVQVLNPVGSWIALSTPEDLNHPDRLLLGHAFAIPGILLYGVGACFLDALACRRFRRDPPGRS